MATIALPNFRNLLLCEDICSNSARDGNGGQGGRPMLPRTDRARINKCYRLIAQLTRFTGVRKKFPCCDVVLGNEGCRSRSGNFACCWWATNLDGELGTDYSCFIQGCRNCRLWAIRLAD